VAPTLGKEAKLGTDTWSFAAPTTDGPPFLFDIAVIAMKVFRHDALVANGVDPETTRENQIIDKLTQSCYFSNT
jgi:hypothetical protein